MIAVCLPGINTLSFKATNPIHSCVTSHLKAASFRSTRHGALAYGTDESLHQRGDLIGCSVQCEMTAVDNVNFGIWHIFAIAFRFARVEREFVLAPPWASNCNDASIVETNAFAQRFSSARIQQRDRKGREFFRDAFICSNPD
jgi:hypothetical protein